MIWVFELKQHSWMVARAWAWFPKGKQTIGDHLFDQSPSWPLWSWQIIYIYNLRWIRNRMTLDDLGIWAKTTFMTGRAWFPKGIQTIGDHLFDQSPSWPLWSWQIIYIYNLLLNTESYDVGWFGYLSWHKIHDWSGLIPKRDTNHRRPILSINHLPDPSDPDKSYIFIIYVEYGIVWRWMIWVFELKQHSWMVGLDSQKGYKPSATIFSINHLPDPSDPDKSYIFIIYVEYGIVWRWMIWVFELKQHSWMVARAWAWFPKGKQTIGDHLFDQSPSWPLWSWQIIYIYNLRWIRNRMTLDDLGIWAETTFMNGRAWFPKGIQTIGDHLFDQSPSWPLWSWQIIYIYNLR